MHFSALKQRRKGLVVINIITAISLLILAHFIPVSAKTYPSFSCTGGTIYKYRILYGEKNKYDNFNDAYKSNAITQTTCSPDKTDKIIVSSVDSVKLYLW